MISQHFKIAWKALLRKKLYTLVSLFATSFTLTLLIVAASFYHFLLKPNYPEYDKNRILTLNSIITYGTNESGTSTSYGNPGFEFLQKYVCSMHIPEKVGIVTRLSSNRYYANNSKFDSQYRYVDNVFWEIFAFDFLLGNSFNKHELEQKDLVAVISESTAKKHFGNAKASLGKHLEIDNEIFRIKGVVKDVSSANSNSYSDIWLPLSTHKREMDNKGLFGECRAIVLAHNRSDFSRIKTEFNKKLSTVQFPYPEERDQIIAELLSSMDYFLREKFGVEKKRSETGYYESALMSKSKFLMILLSLALFLMAFAALNMININTSRVFERSSEIGIRKSFGATRKRIVKQILFDNLTHVGLGGFLAFIFSKLILSALQFSQIIPGSKFQINAWVIFCGVLFILFFSFISGILPALRIAKCSIVQSLNGGKL